MTGADRNTITNTRTTKPSERNISKLKMTGAISSILLLSLGTFSMMNGKSIVLAQPQSNANGTVFKVTGSNAIFEPMIGLTNVFGPGGLFPFKDTFKCAGDLFKCGVSAGNESKFTGTFEQDNKNNMTRYQATYTSAITYGHGMQVKGHTYKITLTDTKWNSTDDPLPTRQPEFAKNVNNVGLNQIQHGASHIDRSDIPQLFDYAFLYGHAQLTDITNGNNTVVAKDLFTHHGSTCHGYNCILQKYERCCKNSNYYTVGYNELS
jgi:hypothetical protein